MPDLGRIYFPANDINNIFFISDIDNTRGNDANISFRITVKDGRRFDNLQYKLGEDDWKTFNPRNISANLYIVRLKPGQMERLLLRLSTGDEEIIVRSVNVQHSTNVEMRPPPPQVKLNVRFDISIIDMTAKQFKTDILIQNKDNKITNTLMDIMTIPRPQGLLLDWQAEKVDLANGRVNSVPDQSGNNRTGITTSSSTRPGYIASDPDCNGKSSIVIDDMLSKSFLQHDFTGPANQPLTYVLVFRGMSTDPGEFYSSTTHAFGTNSVNQYTLTDGVTELTGGTPDTNIHVEIVRMDSSNSQLYIDGDAPKITASFSGSTLSNIVVGDATGPIKEFKMVRFAIWDRALTNAELNQLGSYLARECNITWTPIDPHKFINIDMHLTQNDRPMNFNADIMTFKDNNTSSFKADISLTRKLTTSFKADIMTTTPLPKGLHIDYDSNFVELTSGRVTKLLDQSGNKIDAPKVSGSTGDSASYTANSSKANGNAVIHINSGTNYNAFDSALLSSALTRVTMFFVNLTVNDSNPGAVMNGGSHEGMQLRRFNDPPIYRFGSVYQSLVVTRVGDANGDNEIIAMVGNEFNSSFYYRGGTPVTGFNGRSAIVRSFSIGKDSATVKPQVDFVRALLWDRILSAGEISIVCKQLAAKYKFVCNPIDISVPLPLKCDIITVHPGLPSGVYVDLNPNFTENPQMPTFKMFDQSGNKRDATIDSTGVGTGPIVNSTGEFGRGNLTAQFNYRNGQSAPLNYNGVTTANFPTSLTQVTMFLVHRARDTETSAILNTYQNDTIGFYEIRGTYFFGNRTTSDRVTAPLGRSFGTNMVAMVGNGANSKMYVNGGTAATGDIGTASINRFTVGVDVSIPNTGNDIALGRAILWNRVLTDAELNQAGRYLSGIHGTVWTDITTPPASSPPNNGCNCCCKCDSPEGPTRGEPPKVYTFGMDIICKKQQVINMKFSMRLLKEGSL